MNKINSLDELLAHEIGDLMSAEAQLIEALPKMATKATSPELKKALLAHLKETEHQAKRLDEIGLVLGMKASDKSTCKAMKGLLAEGQEAVEDIQTGAVLDAAIIGAAQRVEHYEMAAYASACSFAEQLGQKQVVKLLTETYEEENKADILLTKMAKTDINPKAALKHASVK